MLLCQGPKTDDKRSPGDPLEYHFDLLDMIYLEARRFISYLKTRTLFVDAWDGDSLIHIRVIGIPLKLVAREGQSVLRVLKEFDVVKPNDIYKGIDHTIMNVGKPFDGKVFQPSSFWART